MKSRAIDGAAVAGCRCAKSNQSMIYRMKHPLFSFLVSSDCDDKLVNLTFPVPYALYDGDPILNGLFSSVFNGELTVFFSILFEAIHFIPFKLTIQLLTPQ